MNMFEIQGFRNQFVVYFALFLIVYFKFNILIQSKARSIDLLKEEEEEFLDLIIDAIQDIKGKNIVQIDLRHLQDAPTRFLSFVKGKFHPN